MAFVVLTQAELSARVGGNDELGIIASANAVLDAAAVAVISGAITDVSGEMEARLAGLGLDFTTTPASLKDIGVDLVVETLYKRVHSLVPKDIATAAKEARDKLTAFISGQGSASGTTTAQQEAARFSWSNIADEPASNNPRQTVRARMRRLP